MGVLLCRHPAGNFPVCQHHRARDEAGRRIGGRSCIILTRMIICSGRLPGARSNCTSTSGGPSSGGRRSGLLLGALLSTNYLWEPQYVGLGVFALAVGALLAVPLSKANLLSRDRIEPVRTDSMTFQPRITWSSHLVRRCIFTFALPIAGLAFTLTSPGPNITWAAPIIMSATVGFLSTLAVAECVGIVMETYDTCDLQPGVNTRHRLASMDSVTRRRRTNYTSFPRVIAGLFASQGLGFFLAAAATRRERTHHAGAGRAGCYRCRRGHTALPDDTAQRGAVALPHRAGDPKSCIWHEGDDARMDRGERRRSVLEACHCGVPEWQGAEDESA
ncbi:hypothetical protein MRB53_041451 [Persea americana]|nr:hypothetical protein MRB53_041451 [Persea americana]